MPKGVKRTIAPRARGPLLQDDNARLLVRVVPGNKNGEPVYCYTIWDTQDGHGRLAMGNAVATEAEAQADGEAHRARFRLETYKDQAGAERTRWAVIQ